MQVFTPLARLVSRHARAVIVTWVIAASTMLTVALVGVDGEGLFDRVQSGAPGVEGSESDYVMDQTQAGNGEDDGGMVVGLFRGVDLADSFTATAVSSAGEQIALREHVSFVVSPFGVSMGADADPSLLAGGGDPQDLISEATDGFLMQVHLTPIEDGTVAVHQTIAEDFETLADALGTDAAEVQSFAYSGPLVYDDFTEQMKRDLITGEAIALPLALIVMVLVFGGFLAASTPLIGALASIAGGMLVLYGFSYPITMDDSAVNVVTVLGIGLSIDYGLLMVSRFREELTKAAARPGGTQAEAMQITMITAGRTVFFSAVTVAIAVGGMITFEPAILRGIGAAALGVVTMALLAALTLVPAIAYLYGPKLITVRWPLKVPVLRTVLAATADVKRDHGAFSRLASWVQRRPWLTMGAATALLLVLASPLLGLQMRNSQEELLPVDNERRQFLAAFQEDYEPLTDPAITVLADADPAALDAWMDSAVLGIDDVRRVSASTELNGQSVSGAYIFDTDRGGAEAVAVVEQLRALDAPFAVYVGGQAANQVDFIESIQRGAPVAVGIVVIATLVLLFLMTGSVLVPIKALVINSLSLAAAVGVVTWVFQYGNLEWLLQFESAGGVETYVVVMIVAFGFGLAMDYDLFLLARIKELVDRGVPNNEAVRIGLQRSGRIITSAAAVIILVFLGFAFGDLLVIKQVGFGLAFAVFLDATVVRMLLVPSTMTLLNEWNWWSPAPLRRLHDRFKITH